MLWMNTYRATDIPVVGNPQCDVRAAESRASVALWEHSEVAADRLSGC